MKKIIPVVLMCTSLILPSVTYASGEDNLPSVASLNKNDNLIVPYQSGNGYNYVQKKVTSTYYEYSEYKKISDILVTDSHGGSISSSNTASFEAKVSGNIYGLNFNLNGKVSNQVGYTLNVKPNSKAYLAYRVKYKVEKGVRKVYGDTYSENKYTVKTPVPGSAEYKLIYK
ncbi:hypothetical protein [Anaerococcus cruorum]|uniref:hypothetical protein n=1 Tax=Anaerococcus sp. WGS1596 TaxID=3366806 RepID=UPI00372D35D6